MNSPVPIEIIPSTDSLIGPAKRPVSLDQCDLHSHWRIVDIVSRSTFGMQDENVTQRLKELGFLPGTPLKIIGFGLFGRSPIAVRINGTKFALRPAEAAKILVESI